MKGDMRVVAAHFCNLGFLIAAHNDYKFPDMRRRVEKETNGVKRTKLKRKNGQKYNFMKILGPYTTGTHMCNYSRGNGGKTTKERDPESLRTYHKVKFRSGNKKSSRLGATLLQQMNMNQWLLGRPGLVPLFPERSQSLDLLSRDHVSYLNSSFYGYNKKKTSSADRVSYSSRASAKRVCSFLCLVKMSLARL